MGLRVITDERGVKVWVDTRGQYPRYSCSLGKKNEAGEYDNFYMEVKFNKDLPKPDNGDEIIINDSFLTFNVWNDKEGKKRTSPYLMIQQYDNLSSNIPADLIDIPEGVDEELPFK